MSKAFAKSVVLALVLSPCSMFAGDLVQWTDEKGMIHFSDSLDNVPEKFRSQTKQEKFKEEKRPERTHAKVDCSGSEGRVLQSMLETWGKKPALAIHEVPFQAYEGTARRVIVPVTFNGFVTVPMAIDTGAPGLIISPKVAKTLGLATNEDGKVLSVTGGIGGRVFAVRTFIDKVQVGGATDSFIPATVAPSISTSFEGLIGMDFMSKYSFKIDPTKQVVVFEELAANSDWPGGHDERWWRSLFKEFHALRDDWDRATYQRNANRQFKEFAGRQVKEADKLLCKLERHANDHFVPQDWR
ncbi:MAG: aspartyl protease family protein [Nitrospira sp.]|nr:aspartyl protease family protein [Nitrospira sp.]